MERDLIFIKNIKKKIWFPLICYGMKVFDPQAKDELALDRETLVRKHCERSGG